MERITDAKTQVTCAKCGHVNSRELSRCTECSAHLQIVCRRCSAVNDRILARCGKCGARLGRSLFSKLKSQVQRRLMEIIIILAGLILLVIIVRLITHWDREAPESGLSAPSPIARATSRGISPSTLPM